MSLSVTHIDNWIDGNHRGPTNGQWIDKYNPHTGALLSQLADSIENDVELAVSSAVRAFSYWSSLTPIQRGQVLGNLVDIMKQRAVNLSDCIAEETGKPPQDAKGEVRAAILQGEYFSSEGMRLYGRSLSSSVPGKYSHTVRVPVGVAGLIVPANTPIANIAWKSFPALVCGNTVVLKAAEDSPRIAILFAEMTKEAGIPDGVFNVIQGRGASSGGALVNDQRVKIISFTGSTSVGRWIAEVGGKRLARLSLELGGKNPFVVCDDADIDLAVHWATLSAFSNAGQRCAAASRLLVFDDVYDEFKHKLVNKASNLKLGISDSDDLGPLINLRQKLNILSEIDRARSRGANILCGGRSSMNINLSNGYYIEPTVIENVTLYDELNCKEIFGPVTTLNKVNSLEQALEIANSSEYGLTSAIHTSNVDRAMWFAQKVRAGVANINMGTYGSEPHMPFGGFGASGNGTREPGAEALDVYTEVKNISFLTRDHLI